MSALSYNINLKASQGDWRLFMTRKADPSFEKFSKKILKKCSYQCQFCAFSSILHLDIVNVDGNYMNNKLSNLVASCPLCTQCFFLESVGKGDFGGGTLIYLPEFSQTQLNASCHVFFSCIAFGGKFAQESKDSYRLIRQRSKTIESKLGNGLSNPSVYGQMLIDHEKNTVSIHEDLQKSIRLLPNLKKFAPLVNQWVDNAVDELVDRS